MDLYESEEDHRVKKYEQDWLFKQPKADGKYELIEYE
jgi:hypothetical protein